MFFFRKASNDRAVDQKTIYNSTDPVSQNNRSVQSAPYPGRGGINPVLRLWEVIKLKFCNIWEKKDARKRIFFWNEGYYKIPSPLENIQLRIGSEEVPLLAYDTISLERRSLTSR